jgi:hypothetical protein
LLREENEQDNAGLQERAPTPTESVNLAPIYFYHPDHLGSSTFLTDANGNAYQIEERDSSNTNKNKSKVR